MDAHNHIEECENRAGQILAFIRGTCIRVQDLVIDQAIRDDETFTEQEQRSGEAE